MTRLLAHAITRRATGGPETGLRGRPLEQIAAGELGLWATVWDGEPTLSRYGVDRISGGRPVFYRALSIR